jgi:hypothetical protein
MSPPCVVVLEFLFPQILRCFEIIDDLCPGTVHSFTAAYRPHIRDILDLANGQPTLSTLAHSSRRAKGSPQVENSQLVRRSGDCLTLRSSRSFSPFPNKPGPACATLDRNRLAFHRMSQINGALLHVSGSACREPCWPAARYAQEIGDRRGVGARCNGGNNFDPGARACLKGNGQTGSDPTSAPNRLFGELI